MPDSAAAEWNQESNNTYLRPTKIEAPFRAADWSAPKRLPHWREIVTREYVSALALSEDGEAMIFERGEVGGGMSSWQVVGGYVSHGEDPMTAVQRTLLHETGHHSDEWLYLGSYMMTDAEDQIGVGHFFCARRAREVSPPRHDIGEGARLRWVTQRDLRCALLDGRVSVLSYAVTISMALLTVLD